MGIDQIHLINPYQQCSDRPLYENSSLLGLPPLLQVSDVEFLLPPLMHEVTLRVVINYCKNLRRLSNLSFLCYLVISGDDNLRVAESHNFMARGEAALRLLDEHGQVVDACSSRLFQNLDLVELPLRLTLVGNMKKCSCYVSQKK